MTSGSAEAGGEEFSGEPSIDESKIDDCLAMLQQADPTGEIRPDAPEMAVLEGRGICSSSFLDI